MLGDGGGEGRWGGGLTVTPAGRQDSSWSGFCCVCTFTLNLIFRRRKKKKEIRPDFKRPHRLKDELNVVQLHLSLRLFSHYGVIKWDEDGISRPRAAFPGSRRRAISANYNLMADWSLVLYFCPFMVWKCFLITSSRRRLGRGEFFGCLFVTPGHCSLWGRADGDITLLGNWAQLI